MVRSRVFTVSEERNRNAWIASRMENDCDGCDEDDHRGWTPCEGCPVHGLQTEAWWSELNVELDRRWPGRWVESSQEVSV